VVGGDSFLGGPAFCLLVVSWPRHHADATAVGRRAKGLGQPSPNTGTGTLMAEEES
jgi:hypothetical protein